MIKIQDEIKITNNKVYINNKLSKGTRENIIKAWDIAKNYKLFTIDSTIVADKDRVLIHEPLYAPFDCFICNKPLTAWAVYIHKKSNQKIHIGLGNCHNRIVHFQYLYRESKIKSKKEE